MELGGDYQMEDPRTLEYLKVLERLSEESDESTPKGEFDRWDTATKTNKGWLMSDPGTRGLLTLENLIAEEEAALRWEHGLDKDTELTPTIILTKKKVRVANFRHVGINGDDSTTIGPAEYLKEMIPAHAKNLMIPSERKFSFGKTSTFCREWFTLLPNTDVYNMKDYKVSMMVDSIKPSFISPETTPSADGTNPSVGKGHALFKRAEWMPEGWKKLCSKVGRARFFCRMERYLYRRKGGRGYNRLIELPFQFGGLAMAPFKFAEWNPRGALAQCSRDHMILLTALMQKIGPKAEILRVLQLFASDRYTRGIKIEEETVDQGVLDYLGSLPSQTHAEVWAELIEQGKLREGAGYRHFQSAYRKSGYVTEKDLLERVKRLENQKSLFSKRAKSGFDDATWEARHENLNANAFVLRRTTPELAELQPADIDDLAEWLRAMGNPNKVAGFCGSSDVYIHKNDLKAYRSRDGRLVSATDFVDESMEDPTNFEPEDLNVDAIDVLSDSIGLDLPSILAMTQGEVMDSSSIVSSSSTYRSEVSLGGWTSRLRRNVFVA
jgi:hypothetical protein